MRICIIDDNVLSVRFLCMLLHEAGGGHEVLCFTDPLEALASMKASACDMAFVDFMMPGMNGVDLIRAIRAMPGYETSPLVMVTAVDETDARIEALEAGATEFLSKPVNAIELRARFRNLVAVRTAQLVQAEESSRLSAMVADATRSILAREEEMVLRLARASEYRDMDTGNHINRVAGYSREIAIGLGLPEAGCHAVWLAAPMHDVGKLAVPDAVLLKPGKLDAAEWALMQSHAMAGYEILAGSESALVRTAAVIARSHHERWDGSGYPDGLKGSAIPLEARIVAVADVFDALVSERPYKRPWPLAEALDCLRSQSGKHFDPACVDAFFRRLPQVLDIRAHADAAEANSGGDRVPGAAASANFAAAGPAAKTA